MSRAVDQGGRASRWIAQVTILASVAVLRAVATPITPSPHDPQSAVFRAYADVVFVETAVLAGAAPVLGLTAQKFQLLDNGVKQHIDEVTLDSLPVDLTLLVDVSGSVSPAIDQFRRDVGGIAGLLRSSDRLRVVIFGTDVTLAVPLQSAQAALAIGPLTASGATSLNDATFYALSQPIGFDRRHLIVTFTDGRDNGSLLGPARLLALAGRSEGVMHVVLWRPPRPAALSSPLLRELMPEVPAPLVGIARATGGDIHEVESSKVDLLGEFSRVLAVFRQSYLLRYTPQGVKREGWHNLVVSVPEGKKYAVRARKGYFVG
jgi:VWFA-related protein